MTWASVEVHMEMICVSLCFSWDCTVAWLFELSPHGEQVMGFNLSPAFQCLRVLAAWVFPLGLQFYSLVPKSSQKCVCLPLMAIWDPIQQTD